MTETDDSVLLVRISFDGEVQRLWLAPLVALLLLQNDPDNGEIWANGHIVGDDVHMGMWDRSP